VRLRPLGKTGLNVTELAVGTFGLSGDGYGAVSHDEAKATLEKALDMGITLFETADAYGAGKMELLLGELTAGLPGVTVVTKVGIDRATAPPKRRFEKEYLEAAIVRSAKRLKQEALDVLLLHHPSDDLLLQGGVGVMMRDFVQRGLIKHWGCAVTSHDVGQFAIAEGAKVIELAYNLTHVRALNRMTGDVMVERTGVLARSVLSYGLFSGMWNKEREFPEGDHRTERWTREELTERLNRIEEFRFLQRDDMRSLRAAALRFALSSSVITAVVLGPKNVEQLKELVRDAGAGPRYMSDDDIKEVYKTLERLGIPI
jgi:aryl-alcohol dehydrogenase-like predicted oxidoreductase